MKMSHYPVKGFLHFFAVLWNFPAIPDAGEALVSRKANQDHGRLVPVR